MQKKDDPTFIFTFFLFCAMDYLKDGESIVKLREGDHKVFTQLMEKYRHGLCVYASSLTKDDQLAEDIVQNIFLRLWKKRKDLRFEKSLKSFLYSAVYNEFIDQYRKSRPLLYIERIQYECYNQLVSEEEREETERALKLVKELINELPPKCKEVFVLSKREGLTNKEIAAHLNITVKGVEIQITRGFKQLRTAFAKRIKTIMFLLFSVDVNWRLHFAKPHASKK